MKKLEEWMIPLNIRLSVEAEKPMYLGLTKTQWILYIVWIVVMVGMLAYFNGFGL